MQGLINRRNLKRIKRISMNLYIESIKLWFKGFSENSQRTITYPFIPNKINVITGDSSTGKSSILGIIDYLFLSDNPVIVENIVNENVEFYGCIYILMVQVTFL